MGSDLSFDRRRPSLGSNLDLTASGVTLHHIVIDQAVCIEADRAPLSHDERIKAGRFHHASDRNRYVQTRAALRRLIGRLQGIAPDAVAFSTGLHGKPKLASPWRDLSFNLSHAGDHALIAISNEGSVGVDIEQPSARIEMQSIAGHFFTVGERQVLDAAGEAARQSCFLAIWTAKEAYAKGLGLGLTLDPVSFEVRPAIGGFRVFDARHPVPPWWVRSIRFGDTLVGAVATPHRVSCRMGRDGR